MTMDAIFVNTLGIQLELISPTQQQDCQLGMLLLIECIFLATRILGAEKIVIQIMSKNLNRFVQEN